MINEFEMFVRSTRGSLKLYSVASKIESGSAESTDAFHSTAIAPLSTTILAMTRPFETLRSRAGESLKLS